MTSRSVLGRVLMESLGCGNGDAVSCRRLAIACVLSLAVHVLVLSMLAPAPSAQGLAAPPGLQARLVVKDREAQASADAGRSEPVVSALAAPKESPLRAPRIERPRERRAEAAKSSQVAADAVPVPTQQERPRSSPFASSGAQSSPAFAGVAATGRSAGFQHVEMAFEMHSGNGRSSTTTGRAVYSASDAHYGIAVQLAPAGAAVVQDGPVSLSVSGVITPRGLSPEVFEVHGQAASNMLLLKKRVDPAGEGQLEGRAGRFRDGLLDRQSLIFHFSLQPPDPGGGKVLLSDGKAYVAFSYRVEPGGQETLPPLGEIRVTRVTLQPEKADTRSGERIELYLVPEMGYLPIRVREIDEAGNVTEQRVTSLVYR